MEQWLQKQDHNSGSDCLEITPEMPTGEPTGNLMTTHCNDDDDNLSNCSTGLKMDSHPSPMSNEDTNSVPIVQPIAASNQETSGRQINPSSKKTDPQSGVYYCPLCSFFTYSKQGFSLHLKRHSKASELEIVQSAMLAASGATDLAFKKSYVCNICGKQLSSKCSLARHGLVHSGLKPYRCSVCSAAFTTSGNLSRHMKIHSSAFHAAGISMTSANTVKEQDESDHCCSLCGMMFKNGKGLRMHNFMIHRNRKPDEEIPPLETSKMEVKSEETASMSPAIADSATMAFKPEIPEPVTQTLWSISSHVNKHVNQATTSPFELKPTPNQNLTVNTKVSPVPVVETKSESMNRVKVEVPMPLPTTSNEQTPPPSFPMPNKHAIFTGPWKSAGNISPNKFFGFRANPGSHLIPRHGHVTFSHPGHRMMAPNQSSPMWHPYMPVMQPNWSNYLVTLQNLSRPPIMTQTRENSSPLPTTSPANEDEPLDLSINNKKDTCLEESQETEMDTDDKPLDLSIKTAKVINQDQLKRQPLRVPEKDNLANKNTSSTNSSNTWVSGFQWLKSIAEMSRQKESEKKLSCPECNTGFDEVNSLKIHMHNHKVSPKSRFPPMINGSYISSEDTSPKTPMENSLLQIAQKRTFDNSFSFSSPVPNVNLFASCSNAMVMSTDHGIVNYPNLNSVPFKDSDGKYQCNMCPKRFNIASTLGRHIKYHNLHRPYVCKYCDASFTYRYNCSRHMIKFHSGENNFPCLFCSFQATGADQLDQHVKEMHSNIQKVEEPRDVAMD